MRMRLTPRRGLNFLAPKTKVVADMDEVSGVTPSTAEIAGFWRRLFAFCLDGLLLGALGAGIGLLAFDALVALEDWGRAVGFAIALIYFAAADSRLFAGRTFGKWLVGIKVVAAYGAPLSVGASALRATVFCVPYFLNGAFIDVGTSAVWMWILLSFLVFGVGISIVYLLIFNRRTRQSLHDLAVGAYVVSDKSRGPIGGTRIWSGQFGVVGAILLASIVLPYLSKRLANSAPFSELLAVQQGLQQEPEVRRVSVFTGVNSFFSSKRGSTTTHILSSKIFVSKQVPDLDALANRSAQIILDRDPSAEKEDRIAISIIYGYDIGIASSWRSRDFAFSPQQWRSRISAP
jgi:uncharacterized RDD family membrane protein YckC